MSRQVVTDVSMLERLAPPAGKDVLDVGCGGGDLVRELAARGARMIGLEISEFQLAPARARDDGSGSRYLVGQAEDLPLEDGAVDVVVFMRTLHHVPAGLLAPALREASRVLRPGGVVYVAEPLAQGDFFVLTSLVEDERQVRAAAQRALAQAPRAGLERVSTVDYQVQISFPDLDALRRRIVSVDPARAEIFAARQIELAEAFGQLGEPGRHPGERCFVTPMRADLLRRAGDQASPS